MAKGLVRQCCGCRRFQAKALPRPPMGYPPRDRTEGSRPFQLIGVDFVRPFKYRVGPGGIGFRQNTDPPGQLTPYKVNGKMKMKKSPELSMGLDSSSSINLSYLKLPRWRSRCRFPTLVLLQLKDLSRKIEHRISWNIKKHGICTR